MPGKKTVSILAVLAMMAVAVPAIAAAAPAALQQPEASGEKKVPEVVRGFYMQLLPGFIYPMSTSMPGLSGGFVMSISAGYDIIDIVAIEAAFTASFSGAVNPESANPGTTVLNNDFTMKIAEINVKVAYVSTERVLGYVKVGGGAAFNSPSGGSADMSSWGPLATAALGVEYYTDIKHFSLGIDVKGYILPTASSYFLAAQPFLKYTF
jgi:hypothetical protein